MKQTQNERRPRAQKNSGQQGKKHTGKNNNRNRRPQQQSANRQYDSHGPGGKQRGNAKQLYEKYKTLASESRGDGQLAESYWQFADHYYRIYAEVAAAEAAQQAAREADQQRRRIENAENMGNSASDTAENEGREKRRHVVDYDEPDNETADDDAGDETDEDERAEVEVLTSGLEKTLGRQTTVRTVPMGETREMEDSGNAPRRRGRPRKAAEGDISKDKAAS